MTKEIRKEAKAYAFRNDGYGYDLNTCEDIFSDGAEWAINKAYNWLVGAMLDDDIYGLGTYGKENNVAELLSDLKKAIKE